MSQAWLLGFLRKSPGRWGRDGHRLVRALYEPRVSCGPSQGTERSGSPCTRGYGGAGVAEKAAGLGRVWSTGGMSG